MRKTILALALSVAFTGAANARSNTICAAMLNASADLMALALVGTAMEDLREAEAVVQQERRSAERLRARTSGNAATAEVYRRWYLIYAKAIVHDIKHAGEISVPIRRELNSCLEWARP